MGYYLGLQKFNPARRYAGRLGLFWAVIFHGFYDFFLFIAFVPGASAGALVSLLIMRHFSTQAIIWHQQLSPFRKE